MSSQGNLTERVLVLTPSGNDAENVVQVLRGVGITGTICKDLAALTAVYPAGAGALLIAEEGLTRDGLDEFCQSLASQPKWSDIPLLIITRSTETEEKGQELLRYFAPHGNVTLVERPLRPISLISAVQVALRGRRKQYELRRFVEQQGETLRRVQETEQRFRAIFNQQFQFMAILSPEGVVMEINELPLSATGISREQVLGKRFWETPFWADLPEMQAGWPKRLESAARSERPVISVDEYRSADGEVRLTDAAITAVRNVDGQLRFFIVQASDITDRKKAEDALRFSEEQNRLIMENVKDFAIFAFDREGRITVWNPGAEGVFGYSSDEAIGQKVDRLFTAEDQAAKAPQQEMEKAADTGLAPDERWHLRKGGKRFFASGATRPLLDDKGVLHGFLKVLRDITEQKVAQLAIESKTRRLQLLADVAHALLPAESTAAIAREIFRCLKVELPLDVYFNYVAEADECLRLDSFEGVSANEASEVTHLTFGERICGTVAEQRKVWIVNHVQESTEPLAEFLRTVGLRAYVSFPLLVEEKLVGTLSFGSRSEDQFSVEDLDYLRTICNFAALGQERILYERNLEETVQARTAELQTKIGELEAFSYSVSHDLRAPLRAMQGYAQVLAEDYAESLAPEAREYLERIGSSAERLDNLVSDILTYGRVARGEIVKTGIDLERLVREVVDGYPALQNAKIDIESPLHRVIGHEGSLIQCISNLLGNAVKFIPEAKTPEIRIWSEELDGHIRINFRDNGIGIPPQDQERIFRIFEKGAHTTSSQGTGIGLAIVRKAVERMDGRIGVESTPGEGSCFWIELARA